LPLTVQVCDPSGFQARLGSPLGVYLNGRGQIELRNPQLDPHPKKQ
jgi:hypothetical protein